MKKKRKSYLEIEKEAIKSPVAYLMLKITKQERREQIKGEAYRARSRALFDSKEPCQPHQRISNSFRK